jgi:hypothetical protein
VRGSAGVVGRAAEGKAARARVRREGKRETKGEHK